MAPQFIFEMRNVSKAFGEKVVLRNINLSFYYGAKIGVVGENGSGKSTLLRIMAGLDREIDGTADARQGDAGPLRRPGAGIGIGQDRPRQPPHGDEARPGPDRPLQRRLRPHGRARRRRRPGQADGRDGPTSGEDRRLQRLGVGPPVGHRLRRPGAAHPTTPRSGSFPAASGGGWPCAWPCWRSPTCCCWTSPPTTSTPKPCNGWSRRCGNIRARSSSSPTTATSSTTSRSGFWSWTAGRGLPFEGNYSSWLAQTDRVAADRGEEGKSAAEDPPAGVGLDSQFAPQAGCKRTRPASSPTTNWPAISELDAKSETIIQIVPGPRLGDKVLERPPRRQGLSAPTATPGRCWRIALSTCRGAGSSA